MPNFEKSASRPIALTNSPLPSASIVTLPSAPALTAQAWRTKASLTAVQATSSTPLARNSSILSTTPGRWRAELVGAAGTRGAGRAMLAMSMREERQVAQDLSPPIAWPTLRLAILLPLAQGALIAGALIGWFPLWAVILPLGYIHFAYYTLVHESI